MNYKQQDSSFRKTDIIEDVEEANEFDEFDLPVRNKSGWKIKIKTQVFESESNQAPPNVADHLSANLN